MWTAHIRLRLGTVAIFYQHSNGHGGPIEMDDFIEYLSYLLPSQEDFCSMELGVARRLILNRILKELKNSVALVR
jgi:hypothetical protein